MEVASESGGPAARTIGRRRRGSVSARVTVIAYIFAKKGEEQRVQNALLGLVEQTRKEQGCINYDLHASSDDARTFVMYENWESETDLDAHSKSAHLREFARAMGLFLERPTEVTKWNMISNPARR